MMQLLAPNVAIYIRVTDKLNAMAGGYHEAKRQISRHETDMSGFSKRALFWTPWALLIVFIAFLSIFALDVFDGHHRPMH
jgi:hypothetical protein